MEKENHLQNAIFGGYVSSLEGTFLLPSILADCVKGLALNTHSELNGACFPRDLLE